MLRYVNDSSRKIYAFELEPLKSDALTGDAEGGIAESRGANSEIGSQQNVEGPADVFSHMGSFNADSCIFDAQTSFSNFRESVSASESADTGFGTEQSGMTLTDTGFDAKSDMTLTSDLGLTSDPQNSDMIGTSMWEWSERPVDQVSQSSHEWNLTDNMTSVSMEITDSMETGKEENGDDNAVISSSLEDKWKSCAICLEELTDNELMVHTSCGGTFCPSCLEVSSDTL